MNKRIIFLLINLFIFKSTAVLAQETKIEIQSLTTPILKTSKSLKMEIQTLIL